MKQTNSAIKFLMAQYRAIFNSAYFKGLAGAAIVTMAMAAGQAQANPIDDAAFPNLTGAENVADVSNAFNLSGASLSNTNEFTLTFTGGNAHSIKGNAAAASATANSGTFVINGTDPSQTKLTIDGSNQSGSLVIKALDVKSGTVELKGDHAKVEATTITLGSDAPATKAAAADSGTAIIHISGAGTLGNANTTQYTLKDGGVLKLEGGKVLGKSLTATGGKVDVTGAAEWSTPFSDAQKLDVSVAGNKTLSVKVPLQDTVRGAIHFASGSTIDLVSDSTSGGKLDINASSNYGSVVILDKGVVLTSSGKDDNGGTISIAGGGADSGVAELQTDADVLTAFLTADSGTKTDVAGSVLLKDNSKLFVTGKKLVLGGKSEDKTAANINIASGSAATAGQVTVSGAATVGAADLIIAGNLTGLDSNLSLDATNLVLGNGEYAGGTAGDQFAKAVTAQNLEVGVSGGFNLGTGVTLSSKDKGTLNGKLTLATDSGSLTIQDGAYTGKADITVGAGEFKLQNSAQGKTASLALAEGSKIVLDDSKASQAVITVSGNATTDVDKVVLDLSKATISYVGDTAAVNATLTANQATLKVNGEDVGTLLERTSTSGAAFVVQSGGKLVVTSDTGFNADQITKDAITDAKSGIQLASGSVIVDGTLSLAKANEITLGLDSSSNNSTLQAKTLVASNDNKKAATTFKSGSFVVTEGLQTDGTGFVVDGKGVLQLGSLDANNTKLATIDKTKTLEVKDADAELNVAAGNWEAGKLTVTDGKFVVGQGTKEVTAKLALDNLIAAKDGLATVEKYGDLTVSELDLSKGNIDVKGSMTVNGKYVAGTKPDGSDAKHGLALKDDSIKLDKGATLTLGADVNHALGIDTSKKEITTVKPVSSIFLTDGVISGGALSTVKLTLDNSYSFSDTALTELSKALFGSTATQGFVDLGGAQIAGLADKYKPTEEYGNTVKWDAIKDKYKDVLPTYKDQTLQQTTVIHKTSDGDVFGHVGAIQTDAATVNVSKNGSLSSADVIDGKPLFVYNATTKEAVKLNLKDDVNFEINGAGMLGDLTDQSDKSAVVLNAQNGKQTMGELSVSDVTVKSGTVEAKSVDVVSLDVQGTLQTLEQGGITAQTLETAAGSVVKTAGTLTIGHTTATNSVIKGSVEAKDITVANHADNTLSILDGVVKADSLTLSTTSKVYVGMDGKDSASGELDVKKLNLSGGMLLLDPEWGNKASLSFVDEQQADTSAVNGSIGVGQNAAFIFGNSTDAKDKADAQAILARYTNGNGSLSQDGVGSLFIVNKVFTVGDNDKIVVNPALKSSDKTLDGAITAASAKTFTLESGAALVVTEDLTKASLNKANAVIKFNNTTGATFDAKSGSSIVFDGNIFAQDTIKISDAATVNVNGSVEAANGLLNATNNAGTLTFALDTKAAEKLYNQSSPVKDLTLAVVKGEYKNNMDDGTNYIHTINGYDGGKAVEGTARLAVYGGAVQGTALAQQAANDAVSERMSRSNPNGSLVFANNAQGGGLWLSPIYKIHESDSFDADGVDYGVDGDLTGLVLGADSTTASGVRVGGYFNFGSASFDGQGVGDQVSNDADYFGFGLYAGMTSGQFSLLADAGFTQVSNDIEQSVNYKDYSKVKADVDSTAITLGLRGEYKLSVATMDVTPHLGVRYTRLNIDSYDAKSNGYILASTDFDAMQMFSIPFGVTVSKDIAAGAWTIKPVFDLTLTANAGDTDAKMNTTFIGARSLDLTSEAFDSFTYGATFGLDAKYGENFSIGLNTNYTGSSNADEFGVMGNARYMF